MLIKCQDAIDLIEPLIHMLEGFPITNVIDQDNAILGVAATVMDQTEHGNFDPACVA